MTLAALVLAALPAIAHAVPLAPEDGASPNADDTTTVYWAMLVIAAVIVVAVNLALVAAVVRFRARRGREATRVARPVEPPEAGW